MTNKQQPDIVEEKMEELKGVSMSIGIFDKKLPPYKTAKLLKEMRDKINEIINHLNKE